MNRPDFERAIPGVLERWRIRLRARGDGGPRAGARGAAERGLVAALTRAAAAPESEDGAMLALVLAATAYANTDRTRRLDPDLVCDQLGALRHELWSWVRDANRDWSDGSAERFILGLDRAISVAVAAILRARYDRGCIFSPEAR